MSPNCLLSLANPNAEKAKKMTFVLAAAEKSDLIFCCHRSFVFIFVCFFLGRTSTLICIFPFAFVHMHMYFPMLSVTFFPFKLYNYHFLCFPSVFLFLVFHRSPIFHWVIIGKLLMLQFFNSLDIVMAIFVYRTYFFC